MLPKKSNHIYYEIFVRSFFDSNNDGIGDINGVVAKLDYLQELGIEGIWLMPIHPSPSYHKYDVTDYYNIDPVYGSLDDFTNLLKEAHKRGIKILIDLVVNHTSSRHPWFLAAQKDLNSPFRSYYTWKKTLKISEHSGWHLNNGHNKEYYFGHFSSEMPDLNYDNPKVREEIIKIGHYWIGKIGVDGFRIDAAQHIYPQHDKNCQWWMKFRQEMESVNKEVLLVGEIWSNSTIIAPYLKNSLQSAFNFDLGYKIIEVVKKGYDSGLAVFHEKIRELYRSQSENYIDATFITNHDQNRIMSEFRSNIDKAKMAASLLFTLPGSPFIYYGEEIGMKGKKPDENIREPFIWNKKKKDQGQTYWMYPKSNKTLAPLSIQMLDKNSLWQHYKILIHLRKSNELLINGEIEPLNLKNKYLVAFYRKLKGKSFLIIHNISGTSIKCELNFEKHSSDFYFKSKSESVIEENVLNIAGFSTVIFG